jgi:hypothetical protein
MENIYVIMKSQEPSRLRRIPFERPESTLERVVWEDFPTERESRCRAC